MGTTVLLPRRWASIIVLILLPCALFSLLRIGLDAAPISSASESDAPVADATIVVSCTVVGATPTYIGATEAGGLWIEDLEDVGINAYRLWTKMAELEWWDDDDALDGLWDDSTNGIPTIAAIKADAASGFTNTIPWAWWDARFNEAQTWRYGQQTRHGIITALVQSGIAPIVTLRTYDDQGQPEMRPGAQWAPRPPVTETYRNEWWEHCFALAYWLNVRHNYGVTHFAVLNEPDYPNQGWQEHGGTMAGYAQLVLDVHDAISFANSFAGLPVYIHAPVVANASSAYIPYTLDYADAGVHIVDYHTYGADPRAGILAVRTTVSNHNPDGILEPLWVSEWGALWSSYNTFTQAMLTANQLLTFAEEGAEGLTIFNMYDWSTAANQNYGLIDLQDGGDGAVLRVPTESYYAYRLLVRGLLGGKEVLTHTTLGFSANTRVFVSRDPDHVYLLVLRNNVGATATVHVDLTAIGSGSGSGAVTVQEYSASHKDVVVLTPTMSVAHFDVVAPANGIILVDIERTVLAARLSTLQAATPFWVELAIGIFVLMTIVRIAPSRGNKKPGLYNNPGFFSEKSRFPRDVHLLQ